MTQMTTARPVVAGPARAWRTRAARYALTGSHCRQCQAYAFPPARRCAQCDGTPEPHALSGQGRIVCLAEDHSPLAGHGGRSRRPFAMIALKEGPVLMAEIVDADYEELSPDQAVEMVVRKWRPEQSGLPLYGFKFKVAS